MYPFSIQSEMSWSSSLLSFSTPNTIRSITSGNVSSGRLSRIFSFDTFRPRPSSIRFCVCAQVFANLSHSNCNSLRSFSWSAIYCFLHFSLPSMSYWQSRFSVWMNSAVVSSDLLMRSWFALKTLVSMLCRHCSSISLVYSHPYLRTISSSSGYFFSKVSR